MMLVCSPAIADVICAPSRSRRLDGLVLCDEGSSLRPGEELLRIEKAPYWQPPSPSTSSVAGLTQEPAGSTGTTLTRALTRTWLASTSVLGASLSRLNILSKLLGMGRVVAGTGLRIVPSTGVADGDDDGADGTVKPGVDGTLPALRSYAWPYQPSPPSGKYPSATASFEGPVLHKVVHPQLKLTVSWGICRCWRAILEPLHDSLHRLAISV
jgi:hypothetical protein